MMASTPRETSIAWGAPSSISVFNAGNHTPLPNVPSQNLIQVKGKNPAFPLSGALPTPVKVERLAYYLEGYNVQLYEELISGFSHGFRLHFHGPQIGHVSTNLLSVAQHTEVVDSKLAKEVLAGRVLGPFKHPPLDNFRVFPLRVIPKKQPGEYRMIHYLSFPHGGSVNDFIPSEFCSVHYASVDDAVRIIKKLGIGCALAKTDVRSAFRIIPVHP